MKGRVSKNNQVKEYVVSKADQLQCIRPAVDHFFKWTLSIDRFLKHAFVRDRFFIGWIKIMWAYKRWLKMDFIFFTRAWLRSLLQPNVLLLELKESIPCFAVEKACNHHRLITHFYVPKFVWNIWFYCNSPGLFHSDPPNQSWICIHMALLIKTLN